MWSKSCKEIYIFFLKRQRDIYLHRAICEFFTIVEDIRNVSLEYTSLSSKANTIASFDSIENWWALDPKFW